MSVFNHLGALETNRTHHKVIAVLWPLLTLGYLSFTTLNKIAT